MIIKVKNLIKFMEMYKNAMNDDVERRQKIAFFFLWKIPISKSDPKKIVSYFIFIQRWVGDVIEFKWEKRENWCPAHQ